MGVMIDIRLKIDMTLQFLCYIQAALERLWTKMAKKEQWEFKFGEK